MRKINIGYIYKITNLVNQKCYIGQTTKPLKERWKKHQKDATTKNRRCYDYPLYRAIRKYGIDNFTIEIIEECDILLLNEREIYWIKEFNSMSKKGYNQTLGGSGNKQLNLDENQVIATYKKTNNINQIAKQFNCSPHSINRILTKHNIQIKSSIEIAKDNGFETIQFDSEHNEIRRFATIRDAARWIEEKGITNVSNTAISLNIRNAILKNHKAYGFYWDSLSYTKKKSSQKENKKGKKKIDKDKINITPKIKKTPKINSCPICNKQIEYRSRMCIDCYKEKHINEFKHHNEDKGITRETLKTKIRNQSFVSLSKEYGVSDNAIRKWCKTYGLPHKSSEIKKYTNEEWETI